MPTPETAEKPRTDLVNQSAQVTNDILDVLQTVSDDYPDLIDAVSYSTDPKAGKLTARLHDGDAYQDFGVIIMVVPLKDAA